MSLIIVLTRAGACFCDSLCVSFGDCCVVCGKELAKMTSIAKLTLHAYIFFHFLQANRLAIVMPFAIVIPVIAAISAVRNCLTLFP